jgi:regulatory protein
MNPTPNTKNAYYQKLLEKIRVYCNYQERCLNDIQEKLKKINIQPSYIEKIIQDLIKEEFVNEERFVKNYVIGKFQNNKWGKHKIIHALRQKNIPDIYINLGLNEINEEDYIKTIKEIISMKQKEIKEKNTFTRQYKIANHLISKGYENDVVWQVLNSIR